MIETVQKAGADSHREMVAELDGVEEGDSMRVVTESEDVLVRANEDACERDWRGDRVVLVQLTIYGNTRADHKVSTLSWWEPGPVLLGEDEFEPV